MSPEPPPEPPLDAAPVNEVVEVSVTVVKYIDADGRQNIRVKQAGHAGLDVILGLLEMAKDVFKANEGSDPSD